MTIVDVHCHLGKWPFPVSHVSSAEMVATFKRWGVSRAVCSSALAIVYDFRAGNQELAEAVASHPELLGYVTINLNYAEEGLAEVDSYLSRPGFVGAKVHPLYSRQTLDSPAGRLVARGLAERRVPLLIHTYSSALESPWPVVAVAKANPDLQIIMAHMGGDKWWEGIQAAGEAGNLFVDPCATWVDADKIAWAVRELGADRILFGSDYSLFELSYCLGMIEDANIALEEKELILHGNAERLFGIPLTAPL